MWFRCCHTRPDVVKSKYVDNNSRTRVFKGGPQSTIMCRRGRFCVFRRIVWISSNRKQETNTIQPGGVCYENHADNDSPHPMIFRFGFSGLDRPKEHILYGFRSIRTAQATGRPMGGNHGYRPGTGKDHGPLQGNVRWQYRCGDRFLRARLTKWSRFTMTIRTAR